MFNFINNNINNILININEFEHLSCCQIQIMFCLLVLFQAMFCYWVTSNLLTCLQVGLLKHPAIRTWLGIPEMVKFESKLSGGFIENMKAGKLSQLIFVQCFSEVILMYLAHELHTCSYLILPVYLPPHCYGPASHPGE